MTSTRPRLRALREERGWTQQEVAEQIGRLAWLRRRERVGVNADMVAKWERGEKRPSPRYRELLCLLFGADAPTLGIGGAAQPLAGAPGLHPPAEHAVALEAHYPAEDDLPARVPPRGWNWRKTQVSEACDGAGRKRFRRSCCGLPPKAGHGIIRAPSATATGKEPELGR